MVAKCQCPYCRSQLSPIEQLRPPTTGNQDHTLRPTVAEAAQRARQAMR
jgi:hypothetical protein